MRAIIVVACVLLTSCAAHVVDENAAATQSAEQQNRHFEDFGVPTARDSDPSL
jgi:hypothetical protein